ncbi:MAG: pyridoxal phosphate-dependent aminotransferase [Oscillospiraceae bacterium]|nr:pyridoxal phosphate-dependent aminotransferase [Oscillospiraceae bacterium]
MRYDFDKVIDRHGSDSLKYDFAAQRGMPKDILPLWVADMDFQSPPEVIEALEARCRHGIFGYSDAAGEEYFNILHRWYQTRFGWEISPAWLMKTPGVMFAACAAIRALSEPGDAVLIQTPVYYPFLSFAQNNGRKPVVSELRYQDGRYTVDLEDFEKKIVQNQVKIFLMCSPHNPVGRVWSEAELTAMGDICLKYGVKVISDEIHADFTFPGHRHTVFAGIKPAFADITVTCTAPSKTFNMAGLQLSNIFVPNPDFRRRMLRQMDAAGYSQPNVMGLVAAQAAYAHGAPWLEELKAYLTGNLDFVRQFLKAQLPQIRLVEPEGTYLLWLDCRALGLTDREIDDLMVHQAGLWLDAGTIFGAGGAGFQRINIGCPRSILQEAMKRMEKALRR